MKKRARKWHPLSCLVALCLASSLALFGWGGEEKRLRGEVDRLRREVRAERMRTEEAEKNFVVAAAICAACVLTVFLVLGLLLRRDEPPTRTHRHHLREGEDGDEYP